MLIYLETIRTAKNDFDFIWSYYIGLASGGEKVTHWTDQNNDRLRAAIVNVGKAARELSETETNVRVIGLQSDIDGKDKRYGGEHDILYSLLCPNDEFEARKLRSLHFEYEKYLSKIMQLCGYWNIKIVLQDRSKDVRYS